MQIEDIAAVIAFIIVLLSAVIWIIIGLSYDEAQIKKKNEYKTTLSEHDLKVVTDYIAKSKLTFKEFMKRKKQK